MAHDRPRLTADTRDRIGSRYARRLRAAGKLPAVLYGHGKPPAHLAVVQDEFLHALHDGAHLIELSSNGADEVCLIRDVQYDYLGTDVIHVDLARVDLAEQVTVKVPIVVHGEDQAPGLREAGAFLSHQMVDIDVTCRADSIPDEIIADIAALELDGSLTVADLKFPEGTRTEHNPEDIVLAIDVTKPEEEEVAEEEAAAEAGAEPEVLSERKTEEEAAEGD